MITAVAITEPRRDRGIFLQQMVSTEEVKPLYFKSPLYGTNEGVAVVDIVGSTVLYFLNKRKKKGQWGTGGSRDYNVQGNSSMTRFAKIHHNKKGDRGWTDCRGRFHKL
jgi:hypothetical protein